MSNSAKLTVAEQRNFVAIAHKQVAYLTHRYNEKHSNLLSKEDIEDIEGDVLLKAYAALGKYDPQMGTLATWMNRIALNCLKDKVDYKMKRLPISCSMIELIGNDKEEADLCESYQNKKKDEREKPMFKYSGEDDAVKNDLERFLDAEAAKMGDKNNEVYEMLKVGYKPQEIAKEKGWTANAVSKRIWGIRNTLRSLLDEVA